MPVRRGDRDPAGQRDWARTVWAQPWVGERQGRVWDRLRALLRELALQADWTTHLTSPGWDRLVEVTRWSRRRLAEWLRQLRLLGWLELVEHGSTPEFRPMALADELEGNRRAVYRLRVPVPLVEAVVGLGVDEPGSVPEPGAGTPETGPPAGSGNPQVSLPVDRNRTPSFFFPPPNERFVGGSFARELKNPQVSSSGQAEVVSEDKIEPLRGRCHENGLDFAVVVPSGRGQMWCAAAQVRRTQPVLARLSTRHVRALCRPFWRAGWTNADIITALRCRPGAARPLTGLAGDQVISPAGWCRSRLAAWVDERGLVLPSPTSWAAAVAELQARHGHAGVHREGARPRPVTVADVRRRAARCVRAAQRRALDAAARRRALDDVRPGPVAAAATAEQRAAARADHERRLAERSQASRAAAMAQSLQHARAHVAERTVARRTGEALRAAARQRATADRRAARGEGYGG